MIEMTGGVAPAGDGAMALSDMATTHNADIPELGSAVRGQIENLRNKTGEMAELLDSMRTNKGGANDSGYADVVRGMTEPSALSKEMGGSANGSMPNGDDIASVMSRSSDVIADVTQVASTSMLFSVGSSVVTKTDSSTKMFIQAQ